MSKHAWSSFIKGWWPHFNGSLHFRMRQEGMLPELQWGPQLLWLIVKMPWLKNLHAGSKPASLPNIWLSEQAQRRINAGGRCCHPCTLQQTQCERHPAGNQACQKVTLQHCMPPAAKVNRGDIGRHVCPLPHQSNPCQWAHMIKRTDVGEPCLGSPRHSAVLQGTPADESMLGKPGPLRKRRNTVLALGAARTHDEAISSAWLQ